MAQSGGRRWWALAALSLVGVIVGLDLTVLNLALPTLALALHASTGQLQWFIDAYSLVLAAALLPAGLLGDRYGRKRVLILALAVFGAGSLVCAYAPSPGVLVAARALLGLGAAFLIPLSLSVLPVLFTDAERPRAIAVVMVGTMLAYPLGPILGGWLLTRYWWGSVFLINVPVVVLALFAVGLLMPESRGEERRSLDGGGILASSAGLVALIYGAIRVGSRGWGDAGTLLALAAGIALLSGFTLWARPMRWWTWTCSARAASPGAPSSPPSCLSPCSASCSPCRSTSRRCGASTRSAVGCGCCP
jgi:MFS family permease